MTSLSPLHEIEGPVLVTGGAGFIGSAVVRGLLDHTETGVINVDKLTYAANLSSLPKSHPRYRLERVDICDAAALREIFTAHKPMAVMHLAAESHVDRSIDGPGEFVRTNLVGTYTLLQEALRHCRTLSAAERKKFRFLHISTDEVFGSLGEQGLFTETSPYAPNSPYSATKAGSDHLVRAWRETYDLPAIVTNCSNNFGPYQFPEKLIPLTILRAFEGKSLPVYGDGMNVRDWLYVEDHAHALMLVLARGAVGETYNIGGRSERTNKDVVGAICELMDGIAPPLAGPRRDLIEFVKDRPGHDRRYAIDASKIERELGWRPGDTFEARLAETVRWYLNNAAWWQGILQNSHATERVGAGVEAESVKIS